MIKILKVIICSLLLVACGNKTKHEVTEEVFKCDDIKITDVDIDYKIVDEDDNEVTPSEDEEFEVITEGVKGCKKVVTCNDEYLNEWLYTEKTNEVVKVVKKETEMVDSNNPKTPSTKWGDNGGSTNPPVTPPTNNGGGNNNNGGNTTPPVTPEPPYIVAGQIENTGNEGLFNTMNEAKSWGKSQIGDYNTKLNWEKRLGIEIDS